MSPEHWKATFFRSFSVLTNAGISLPRTLEMLDEDLVGKRLATTTQTLQKDVLTGSSLVDALKKHRGVFSSLQIHLIELGCQTGSFATVLNVLAGHAEGRSIMRRKLQAALIYPLFLLVGCTLFVTVVPAALFRHLFELLQDSQLSLPWYTKAIMTLSQAFGRPLFWLALVVGVVLSGLLLRRWFRVPKNRRLAARVGESPPWVGEVMVCARLSSFCEALAMSTRAGMAIDKALVLACLSSGSQLLKDAIPALEQGIRGGQTVTEVLAATGLFPTLLLESVRAGEESGELAKMCSYTAKLYAVELDASLERFTTILEPLALLLMGAVVALLALSCISPLAESLNSL